MLQASRLAIILSEFAPKPTSSGVELGVWKWVIIIGASAIALFYVVKRIADVVVKKKTDDMIRSVGEDPSNDKSQD